MPTDEELAEWGFRREDVAADYEKAVQKHAEQNDLEIFRDCWDSVMLFRDLMTQWRVGIQGATGLDYTAIPIVMDLRRIDAAVRKDMFSDLRVMEIAALETMRSKK